MGLNKVRIGTFVEIYNEACNISNLTVNDVSGVNREKEFFEPSKQVGADTSKYKVVPPKYFACNLMHVGRDVVLPIAINQTDQAKYVSPAYTVFKIVDEQIIIKEYFYILLKSNERDRYFWFNTDSSVRDGMDWNVFCNVELNLPDIDIQNKTVEVYNAMVDNQLSYETGLDDLKLTCDAYIEKLRRDMPCYKIGDYIQSFKEKNTDGKITLEQGININKEFITPQRSNSNLLGRQIVKTGQFAYCTQLNNSNVAIAYRKGPDCVVSAVYDVFEIIKPDKLIPEYLMLWLIRKEFGRFVYWASQGTSYEFLSYDNLANYKIPVPSIDIQRDIAEIYNSYIERKAINELLKAKLKDMCPILIKYSIEEARRQ